MADQQWSAHHQGSSVSVNQLSGEYGCTISCRYNYNNPGYGEFFIDDVILEPGVAATNRDAIGERVALSDTRGTISQSFVRKTDTRFGTDVAPSSCLDQYAFFAANQMEVAGLIHLKGTAMAGQGLQLHSASTIEGNVATNGTVWIGDRATVIGSVT